MKTVKQASNAFAFRGSKKVPVNQADTLVKGGGIAELKGGKHRLRNVCREGDIKGGGVYPVIMATEPGTELDWDNTGLKDRWITNGGEACFRAMGKAKRATIRNVDFQCRKWKDDKGRVDYWKGWGAIRDIALCEFIGGRGIGPFDVGEQENAGAPQTVGLLTITGMGLTHMPRISRPKTAAKKGRSGVQKIVIKNCPKLKATYDKKNPLKLVKVEVVGMWPNVTLTPDK